MTTPSADRGGGHRDRPRTGDRSQRARTAMAAVVTLGLLALATGCGVPLDDEPRTISQTTVTADVTPPTVAPSGGQRVSVFFVRDDRLEAQTVEVDGEATLRKALGFAVQPPPEGSPKALHSSVPPGTALRNVSVQRDGTAVIDLTNEISDVSGQTQIEAFAQLVFTALEFSKVQRVRFQIKGVDKDTPTEHGNQAVADATDYDLPLKPR